MTERKILLVSVGGTTLFALLGVVWGIVADSSMIIFDGIYSLISVGLSSLSLFVLKQIQTNNQEEDSRYPFGKAHFEPLLIVFKSLTLIGMCLFSAVTGVSELLTGGRDVSPGSAVIYAFISTIGCFLVTVFIQQKNKICESSLLDAEKNQWFGDMLLSFGVLVGFLIAYMLVGGALGGIVPYADPAMVVIASSVFIFLPLKNFIAAAKEVICYRMDEKSMAPVRKEAASVAGKYNAEYKLRMIALGRELCIEVNFLVKEDIPLNVAEMDGIRSRFATVASDIKKQHWINVNFTQEKSWL